MTLTLNFCIKTAQCENTICFIRHMITAIKQEQQQQNRFISLMCKKFSLLINFVQKKSAFEYEILISERFSFQRWKNIQN